MGIVWTLLGGLAVGLAAKMLHPGKAHMGLVTTIALGAAGAFLAGLLGQSLGWYRAGEGAGFIASLVASIVLLVIYGRLQDKEIKGDQV